MTIKIVVFIALVALDRLTKVLAMTYLKGTAGVSLISGILEFQYVENTGAAFGAMLGQNDLIIAINMVLVAAIGWLYTYIPQNLKWQKLKYCVIALVAGATGNMIDRFMYGYVVDFIYFKPINFPKFNLADSYIVVSMILAFIFICFVYKNDDFKEFGRWKIRLRLEKPEDYREVEEVTREAFWRVSDDVDEHFIAHKLRESANFVPELDFVAEMNGRLVGNVMYSKAKIVSDDGTETPVLTFGPLSVTPIYQNKGVGTALLEKTIKLAKAMDYPAIVILGEPDYYPAFGFERAESFGLTMSNGETCDAFMCLPLKDNALDGVTGKFYEDEAFHVSKADRLEFDKNFPRKEPYKGTPLKRLFERLPEKEKAIFEEKSIEKLEELSRFSGREIAGWGEERHISNDSKLIINDVLIEHDIAPRKWPGECRVTIDAVKERIPESEGELFDERNIIYMSDLCRYDGEEICSWGNAERCFSEKSKEIINEELENNGYRKKKWPTETPG